MDQIRKMAMDITKLIDSKKGLEIKVLDVRGICSLTDYMVIATGTSDRHVSAIASGIEEGMKDNEIYVDHKEGHRVANWIILDYLDVVVHIFMRGQREFYDLEHIWNESKVVDINHIIEW